MAPRSKKAVEKDELKRERMIWVGIAATEANLQRLGTLLLFADRVEHEPPPDMTLKPLPWDDPADHRYIPVEPQVDYNLVRRDIVKLLEPFVARFGKDEAKALIEAHGAPLVRQIEEPRLLDLYHALNDRLNPETSE